MLNRRILLLAALAAATTLGLRPSAARANFSYNTTVTAVNSGPPANDTDLTITGVTPASVFATPVSVKVADVFLTNNGAGLSPNMDTFTYKVGALSIDVNITDTSGGGGSGTITLSNTSVFTVTTTTTDGSHFSTTSTSDPFGTASASATINGTLYTVSAIPGQQYNAPGGPPDTAGQGEGGGFGFHITSTPAGIPEPGSMALLGIGLVGAVGVYRRRMARR